MGNAYLTGSTASTNFPTVNPRQPANAGDYDAFVTKFNVAGSTLLYSTYHGGAGSDAASGIAVDSLGYAYTTGNTASTNFPTVDPLYPAYGGGTFDAFITKDQYLFPRVKITMSGTDYVDGQAVTATEFLFENPNAGQATVELAVWLEFSGLEPISIIKLGADGSFILPGNFSQELGPLTLFTVTSSLTRGRYAFNSRIADPVTNKFLSEDLNPFYIR